MKTFFPLVQVCEFVPRKPQPERKPLEKITPEKITITALNGHSISRCQHSSFWTEKYGPIYCATCNPAGVHGDDKGWEIPRRHLNEDRTYANPTAAHGSSGQCPECHCQFHVEVDNGKWQCPDCGHVWKGKVLKDATAA